ncbi:hypothetical protein CKO35_09760 [Ectothiorhodospira shaposhnikovii]|uniref:polysaccharide biosynthesis/export family protein n=1 Tax=Ectothiorhodospira shaposhnikovii TaxID=1054 RepID=UPI0019058159|nr:polysaccharide biosynthesis/export family protein [Ectothiorhodospira shaposhnikovii]MBK1673587.1 hypothetical protein [Ectothiorhodospira shaposhnikovii]
MKMPTPPQLEKSAAADGIYETPSGLRAEVMAITPVTVSRQDLISPPPSAPMPLATPEALQADYRIAVRDVLEITVWGQEEFALIERETLPRHVVAQDGTIFFPYVGRVRVAGLSAQGAQTLITQRLSRVFEAPQVDVRVLEYRGRQVRVVGAVGSPGPVAIQDRPITLIDAIYLAGGPLETADLRRVSVTRNGHLFRVNVLDMFEQAEQAKGLLLQETDLVYVPDNSGARVYVMGEVKRNSSLAIPRAGLTLTQALAESAGPDPITSRAQSVYVLRGTTELPRIFYLDLRQADGLLLGDRFQLAGRDVIYVDAAPITRWNRFINQLLPSLLVLTEADRGPLFSH